MEYSLHGANPINQYQKRGIKPPNKIIDFSTNTNIYPVTHTIDFKQYIYEYPDPSHSELKEVIAKKHIIKNENIIISNGINELLYLLPNLYAHKRIGLITDDYVEYKRAFTYHNNITFFSSLYDVKDVDVLLYSNPNNPSGTFIEDITFIKEQSTSMILIIDQSYIEFIDHQPYPVLKNVLYLRSLTKIYHLSGIRIGYAYGDEELVHELSNRQPTWSVNGVALALSKKYVEDTSFLSNTKKFYYSEIRRVKQEISQIPYEIKGGDANFMLISVNDDEDIIIYLLRRGIVVRHTRNFPGLAGKYIRVSVKSIEENNILINALKEYKHEIMDR